VCCHVFGVFDCFLEESGDGYSDGMTDAVTPKYRHSTKGMAEKIKHAASDSGQEDGGEVKGEGNDGSDTDVAPSSKGKSKVAQGRTAKRRSASEPAATAKKARSSGKSSCTGCGKSEKDCGLCLPW
jgi:hypothetical protein